MMNSKKKTGKPSRAQRRRNGIAKEAAGAGSRGQRGVAAPAAIMPYVPPVGLNDLLGHEQSWVAGQLWVGDGSDGVSGSLYFATNTFDPATTAGLVPGNSGGGQVPVLGSDASVGKSYISDIRKHFARIRVRKCKVTLVPLRPNTSTEAGIVTIAPVRGAGASGDTVVFKDATTAAPTIANTIAMAGAATGPTWQTVELDLTPYISNGTGPDQNEYATNLDADTTAWGTGAMDMDLTCPCAFVVAGTSNVSGGAVYSHVVVVTQIVDLLDFIAGNVAATPEAFLLSALRQAVEAGDVPAAVLDRLLKSSKGARLLLPATKAKLH